MSSYRVIAAAIGAALFLLAAAPSNDEIMKQVRALHWTAHPVHLDASHATLTPPAHVVVARGSDARTYTRLINGDDQPSVEAVAADPSTGENVYFEYSDDGYVTSDDWKDVDADQMLQNIKKNTEDANADRKAAGVSGLHVIGWVQKPAYDPRRNIVTWAISAREDDDPAPIVNNIALVLGRHGYQRATWVGPASEYGKSPLLDRMLAGDHFDKGSRYSDFLAGDKLAGYGIAALVGTAAGATIAKTVGFGGLLLLIKKLWLLIVAGIAGAYRWIRSRFFTAQS